MYSELNLFGKILPLAVFVFSMWLTMGCIERINTALEEACGDAITSSIALETQLLSLVCLGFSVGAMVLVHHFNTSRYKR